MTGAGRRRRVGVNLLWLVPGVVGGSEEHMVRLLHGVADLAPADLDLRLYALSDLRRAHPDLVARFPTRTVGLRGRAKPLRVAAETTWLPAIARGDALDLAHHAGGVLPLLPSAPRTVLTVHDLQPLDHPENFGRVKVAYLRAALPRSVRRADVVTTPSRATADRLVQRLDADPARVRVVPLGLDGARFAPAPAAAVAAVRRRFALPRRWLVYPVITYPHKDHVVLVRAFAALARTHPDVDLVLTGAAGPAEAAVMAEVAAAGVADRVHRTGRVARDDLDALLTGAAAVPFPSRYEGFGNGALEAMALGVPVVAADALSLPEVVGDAGLLVPPGDVAAWTAALARVLDDPAEAARLGAAGRRRAVDFTDEAAAEALVGAYRLALDGPTDSGAEPPAG